MQTNWSYQEIKNFILDLLFPKFCLICQKEGDYLCDDCKSVLEISRFHKKFSSQNLSDLYVSLSYNNPFVRNLIKKFKYDPFVKELSKTLSSLIIEHLQLLDNKPDFRGFVLMAVPLEKRRLKWRGFNQAEEIAKDLAIYLKIPLISDCLVKIRPTLNQAELTDEERKENIKGVFQIKNPELIRNQKIILIDDVFTTGSTMEECGHVLKEAGAKKIIGMVVARG